MIKRDFYLDKLKESIEDGEVKVITGIRRSGKSVLLFDLFGSYLLENGVKSENIIKLKLDEEGCRKFRNPLLLQYYVESIINDRPSEEFYLFIDEIQMTEKVRDKGDGDVLISIHDLLNGLRGKKNLDVYVTGSNSKGLSSDVRTEFRGRATEIHIWPLSFAEYYSSRGGAKSEALMDYLDYGGMPKLLSYDDGRKKQSYLKSLVDDIYLKDIAERYTLERKTVLPRILANIASQVGSLTNTNNIANVLNEGKKKEDTKIRSELVSIYLSYLENAFLISIAERYDVIGKEYLRFPEKYYFSDNGIRNTVLGWCQMDRGYLLENTVYNDLLRRGYSVDVGLVRDRTNGAYISREIDFIVNDVNRRVYIQTALSLEDDSKTFSERRPLLITKDHFKKVILRGDMTNSFYDEDGIFNCSIYDFLLDRVELF